jgi:SAM-dependent methyltransferase
MNWRRKAAIQKVLSVLPGGTGVNYLLQRLIRRSWNLDDETFLFRVRLAADHLGSALEHLTRPASSLATYEFGAGSDLIGPLTFFALGVPSQVVVDQAALLRPSLVADALVKFRRHGAALGLSRVAEIAVDARRRLVADLRDKLGIDYRAPVDSRRTGLASRSVDVITSNSTLEHVPREHLGPLMAECRRLLKDDGVICFRIDYEDHYAILDGDLSAYNFLRYSEREWRRYNSRLHFQNRMRHSDYLGLFRQTGFAPIRVNTLEPSREALADLARLPIDVRFRSYALADLGTRKGTFLLKKASSGDGA